MSFIMSIGFLKFSATTAATPSVPAAAVVLNATANNIFI